VADRVVVRRAPAGVELVAPMDPVAGRNLSAQPRGEFATSYVVNSPLAGVGARRPLAR
jgi:hypothetical protein